MNLFAFILDGDPPTVVFERQLEVCVFVPAATIFLSWVLMRLRKQAIFGALALAALGAAAVLFLTHDLLDWGYPYAPSLAFTLAPWVASAVPFLAVAGFYTKRKEEPNQALQPTALLGRG